MAQKGTPKEPDLLEIDGVPTAAGLAKMGRQYAYIRPDGRWQITDLGHAEMGRVMRERALDAIFEGKGDWVQPPSRTDLGGTRP